MRTLTGYTFNRSAQAHMRAGSQTPWTAGTQQRSQVDASVYCSRLYASGPFYIELANVQTVRQRCMNRQMTSTATQASEDKSSGRLTAAGRQPDLRSTITRHISANTTQFTCFSTVSPDRASLSVCDTQTPIHSLTAGTCYAAPRT